MNTKLLTASIFGVLASFYGTQASVINLDASISHQPIKGFGGAVVWAEGTVVNRNLYHALFSSSGLNVSFLRVRNWYGISTETSTATIIRQFRNYQPNGSVIMSSWSPPASLKSNGRTDQGGTLRKVNGGYDYPGFGAWWLNSLNYYASQGAVPDYVSIQNEPDYSADWDSCLFDAADSGPNAYYDAGLNAVWNKFQAHGYSQVQLVSPESGHTGNGEVQNYLNNLYTSHVGAIAFHLYGDNVNGSGGSNLTTMETNYRWWDWMKFQTEYNGDVSPAGTPGWLGPAITIHRTLTMAEVNAYLAWQLVDGPGQGCMAADGTRHDLYYALGQYSKFIVPGDVRMQANSDTSTVLASAYRHSLAGNDRIVVVLINTGANYDTATLTGNNIVQGSWNVYTTGNYGSYNHRLYHSESYTGSAHKSTLLAPYSVTTVIIN